MSTESLSELESTLTAVAQIMAQAKEPWWIIGSAAVSLHLRQEIGVNDVDILLSVGDARHVREVLAIPSMPISPHPLFHSEEYFTWDRPALPAEFMAGFSVCVEGEWCQIRCRTRQAFDLGGHTIYAPDKQELKSLLEIFGRPKDLARLALLNASSFSV